MPIDEGASERITCGILHGCNNELPQQLATGEVCACPVCLKRVWKGAHGIVRSSAGDTGGGENGASLLIVH